MLGSLTLLVHGLWVWHTPQAAQLRDFCQTQGITEVYVSFKPQTDFASLIETLHRAHIRVEALLSSTDADEPGPHRDKLLDHARAATRFKFDGIHLDIEPQQRPENKGPGNLAYLPNLIEAYRAVRTIAEAAGMTVDADIQTKVLKGTAEQRLALLTALPRLTLMLYQQSDSNAATKMLAMAYAGIDAPNVATMVIGLRTPDYGDRLPQALQALDDAQHNNPHYAGWARHSYNDVVGQ